MGLIERNNQLKEIYGRKAESKREEGIAFFMETSLSVPLIERLKQNGSFETQCSVMFIDIFDFSRTVLGMKSFEIEKFLKSYYAEILPIIYDFDGIVEKIMGDGIVVFFPYDEEDGKVAFDCADNLIRNQSLSTMRKCKAAVSVGTITICQIGEIGIFTEFTFIGSPLTEVYRLESMADENQILCLDGRINVFLNEEIWDISNCKSVGSELKGTGKSEYWRAQLKKNYILSRAIAETMGGLVSLVALLHIKLNEMATELSKET